MIPSVALHARSVWLDSPVDLLEVAGSDGWLFERDRAGLACRGVAMRVPVSVEGGVAPAGAGMGAAVAATGVAATGVAAVVAAALRGIDHDDDVGVPGSGPIAVGALPFDRSAPAELVVPAVTVGRTADGRCWTTTIGPGSAVEPLGGPSDPDGFSLTSPIPHQEWRRLVSDAVDAIALGRFSKVVLAREVAVSANRDIDVPTVLRRLRSLYPACTVVSAPVAEGQFVAASPELLVSRCGTAVRSHPLAGTIPRSGDPGVDDTMARDLLASAKDRAEHGWVVDDVAATLAEWCTSLTVPPAPSIVPLRNVSHLGTLITGVLRADAPSALGLAALLHPTAAVGGTPREAALAWLAANEHLDRGPYAGPAGWVDSRGDGEWVIGIRSAVVSGPRARLFAGVGVVDGSDPAAELAETQFKLQALLAAVVRP